MVFFILGVRSLPSCARWPFYEAWGFHLLLDGDKYPETNTPRHYVDCEVVTEGQWTHHLSPDSSAHVSWEQGQAGLLMVEQAQAAPLFGKALTRTISAIWSLFVSGAAL